MRTYNYINQMKVGFHAKGSKYDCDVKGISDEAVKNIS